LFTELPELVKEGRAKIIGIGRQELFSGIKNSTQFAELKQILRSFPDELVTTADHEAAALAGNHCRAHGIPVALADMLLCAVFELRGWPIFASDANFRRTIGGPN
jgi:predicted nucleic acid-binding protein